MTEAGMTPDAVKTCHHTHDRLIIDPLRPALSRALPIALAKISEPLRLLHGGPLRIVAPGFPRLGPAETARPDRAVGPRA